MTMYYKEYSWDNEDLLACANVVRAMRISGMEFDEVAALDFGNLDVDAVWEED